MDVLKNLLNNPAFDHLAENIIRFMHTDEAMETMIESEFLTDEERKAMRKILRKLMFKEAKMYCEKKVEVKSKQCQWPEQHYKKVIVKTTLYEMYPFFKDALQELNKSESLESFNQLYDILVWLQPGKSQLHDEFQLQNLYDSIILTVGFDPDFFKGPADMIEVFKVAHEGIEFSEEEDDYNYETGDEDDYDLSDFENWDGLCDSDDSDAYYGPGNKYDYDSIMEYGLQW